MKDITVNEARKFIESVIVGLRDATECEYIGGPMRGYENYNFAAFDRARDRRIKAGKRVISPADMDRARGFSENSDAFNGADFHDVMRLDLMAIAFYCTGIYLLKGWSKSSGAKIEWVAASATGKTIKFERGAEKCAVALQPLCHPVEVI